MSLPTSQRISPENENELPPARRRRQRRSLGAGLPEEKAAFLEDLAHRVVPSFDFFLFSLLAGLVLAVAVYLDAPALFLLAALISPFLAPVIGLSLATALGSARFFLQSLGGMLLGSLLVFVAGALTGLASRFYPLPYLTTQSELHAHLSWPDFALLTLGAVLTTYLLVRSPRQRPLVASVALAYELYLPIGVSAFGLVANRAGIWPDGLLVFVVHLGWTVLAGAVVLAIMGFRPQNFVGYTLGTSIGLAAVAAVLLISGMGTALSTNRALPPVLPTRTMTSTLTATLSGTPQPPTETPTPTQTLFPSKTPTQTITPRPTPVFARINAGEFNGALIRKEPNPNAEVVKSLLNGMLVEVLPDVQETGGIAWVHVITADRKEGWIVRSLLITATPQPN
jgi:uncharacterized membrane protein